MSQWGENRAIKDRRVWEGDDEQRTVLTRKFAFRLFKARTILTWLAHQHDSVPADTIWRFLDAMNFLLDPCVVSPTTHNGEAKWWSRGLSGCIRGGYWPELYYVDGETENVWFQAAGYGICSWFYPSGLKCMRRDRGPTDSDGRESTGYCERHEPEAISLGLVPAPKDWGVANANR